MSDASSQLIMALMQVVAFLIAVILHECAHGFVAYKLGDPTAKLSGRLTLNPVKHIDLWGSIIIPGLLIVNSFLGTGGSMIFGYAKPVPYNPGNFKDIRKGELLTALAGPASNLVMAVIGAFIAHGAMGLVFPLSNVVGYYLGLFGALFCMINLCLAFFNLIPLPPLDGSAIVAPFLSDKALATYYKVQRYGMVILLLLILVLPRLIPGVDVFGWYLSATAGNLYSLLMAW